MYFVNFILPFAGMETEVFPNNVQKVYALIPMAIGKLSLQGKTKAQECRLAAFTIIFHRLPAPPQVGLSRTIPYDAQGFHASIQH